MQTNAKFILLRHGQTEANREGVIQGQNDTSLTDHGKAESERAAQKIKTLGAIDALYCSDLPRAKSTAKILAKIISNLPEVIFSKDIREIDFGEFSGLLKEKIMPTILRHKKNKEIPYPNGESSAEFTKRVVTFFTDLVEAHSGEKILVVTHYGVIETAIRHFANVAPETPIVVTGEDVIMLTIHEGEGASYERL